MKRILAVRQDNNGDVLLAGPALRAIAASSEYLALLCGPRGAAAGRMLPHVDRVMVAEAAWIDAQPRAVDRDEIDVFVDRIGEEAFDEAVIFTSFHQSPLPMALLLRLAAVRRIGAISVDYPGSLLDVRHNPGDDIHEVERALSLAAAMGHTLPVNDDRRLRMRALPPSPVRGDYVVVHPGCTQPARTWKADGFARTVQLLDARGIDVVVTGAREERELTASVASCGKRAIDFGGRTTFAQYAAVVGAARAVVTGNTATAHVAAATQTPVVHVFPPTIPFARFAPWMVPHAVFGDHDIACSGCRARVCPIPGQPCLRDVTPEGIVDAVQRLWQQAVPA